MATEIELKLSIQTEYLSDLEACSLIQGAKWIGERNYLNTYFDTPAHTLHAHRIALRVRDTGNRLLQTVKAASESVAGLSIRPEWEKPYTGNFDFGDVSAVPVRRILETLKNQLIPIFSTNFTRKIWQITCPSGAVVQLMLDIGQVKADQHTLPISEVEIELVEGTSEDVLAIGQILQTRLPLVPSNISKAEQGFALLSFSEQTSS